MQFTAATLPCRLAAGEHFFIKLELCGDTLNKPAPPMTPSLPPPAVPLAIEPASSTSSIPPAAAPTSGSSHSSLQHTQTQQTQGNGGPALQGSSKGGRGAGNKAGGHGRVAMTEAELLEVMRQVCLLLLILVLCPSLAISAHSP
jgi:hypothetical protein